MNFQNVIYNVKTGKYTVIDFDYSIITDLISYESDIDVMNGNLRDGILFLQDHNDVAWW